MSEPVKILDEVPWSDAITDYDRAFLAIFVRLLDAMAAKADPYEVARAVLNLDPDKEPERAKRVLDAHFSRAIWLRDFGFRHLLAEESGH